MDEISRAAGIYGGVTYERLANETEGLQWPIVDADDPGAGTLYSGGFERGKGKLTPAAFDRSLVETSAQFPLLAVTGRTPLWNTGAISSRSKGLMAMWGEAAIKLHPEDAGKNGIGPGDLVRITSPHGAVEMRAKVTEEMLPGQVFLPIHHPDQPANKLVPFGQRTIKSFPVKLERIAGPAPKLERLDKVFGTAEIPIVPTRGPVVRRPCWAGSTARLPLSPGRPRASGRERRCSSPRRARRSR
jgi:predicted molibdopterin-dependent oxidoreductase YjgC